MIKNEIMAKLKSIIEETHAGVLSTVDINCVPHSRWVTPGCIEERPGAIYIISASNLPKVEQLRNNPHAELLFQNKSMNQIMNISGIINILDNPSIRSEVLECVGKHLQVFWKINRPENELVVLELIIELITLYDPMRGSRVSVDFVQGE